MMRLTWDMKKRGFAAAALCLLPLFAGGCLLGALAYKTVGPPPVPARYVPKKEPMLVLVENFHAAATGDTDADRLGRYIAQDLKDHDVAPQVDFDKVNALRGANPEGYRKMSIAAVGRAVGARQIVYVDLTNYTLDAASASEMLKGQANVKVKVVDAETGQSRWPTDAAGGEPLSAQTQYAADNTAGHELHIKDQLNHILAVRVGKLFHEWKPEYDNEEQTGWDREEPNQ